MKLTPGVKLVFRRSSGSGRTSYGFAYGKYNVADIWNYMIKNPAIGGTFIDMGVDLARTYKSGSDNIVLIVAANDDVWVNAMNKVYNGCKKTIDAWNRSSYEQACGSKGSSDTWQLCADRVVTKYNYAYCDKSKPDVMRELATGVIPVKPV